MLEPPCHLQDSTLSQMVCTQSEPAEIPQHMFVQILVQGGGDRTIFTLWGDLRQKLGVNFRLPQIRIDH